jgi:hypothetical protein
MQGMGESIPSMPTLIERRTASQTEGNPARLWAEILRSKLDSATIKTPL